MFQNSLKPMIQKSNFKLLREEVLSLFQSLIPEISIGHPLYITGVKFPFDFTGSGHKRGK